MDEFTKAEIDRINKLYGTDFKDIQPEDALLIARYEAVKAANSTEVKAKVEAIQAESQAKMKQDEELYLIAKNNLEILANAAKAKYKAVKDEQQEQA